MSTNTNTIASAVVPAAITTRHVPSVPLDVVTKMACYTDWRPCSFSAWYRNSTESNTDDTAPKMMVAYRDQNVSTPQLFSLTTPGGPRTPLFEATDSIQGVTVAHDGTYMVYSININGSERHQLCRFDFADKKTTVLTDGKSKHTSALFSKDGQQIAYTSNARNGKDMDMYVMNPLDPTSARCVTEVSEGAAWSILDWNTDTTQLLVNYSVSVNESSLWLVDVATGTRLRASPAPSADEKTTFELGSWLPHGAATELLVVTTVDSEFSYLARMDVSSGAVIPITKHIGRDTEAMTISEDGHFVAYTINDWGVSRLFIWEIATDTHSEIVVPLSLVDKHTSSTTQNTSVAGVIGGLEWRPMSQSGQLCFTITACSTPHKICVYDVHKCEFVVWDACELPALKDAQFPVASPIKWTSADGLDITGFMVSAPESDAPGGVRGARKPVMVCIHGGPESQWRPTFLARQNYWISEMGITMVFPNIRGSTGFGKAFTDLDNGYLRENAYRDIEALIDWLKTRDDVDPDRIGVMGGSYGGHVTLAIAYRYSDHIKCAIDVVGMSNLVTFLEHTEDYRKDMRRVEYGDERDPAMRKFLESIAPMNHVAEIKKPMMVIQGANDPRIPVSESIQIVEALEAAGADIWYVEAANEGHGFARRENIEYYLYVHAMFFQTYLLC